VSSRPIFGTTRPTPTPAPQPQPIDPGFGAPAVGVAPDTVEVQPFGVVRDSFWPRSAISWLVLAAVLVVAAVQLVTPTRRWRLRRPASLRRPAGRSWS
jgi:hypothetical protein